MTSKRRSSPSGAKASNSKKPKAEEVVENVADGADLGATFVGDPIPAEEAERRWPHRYRPRNRDQGAGAQGRKSLDNPDEEVMQARRHFSKAKVDGQLYDLNDCAYVQSEPGTPNYICRIIEMFEGIDKIAYFRARWFYRSEDTPIRKSFELKEDKRIFLSEVQDDNPLDCLVKRLNIIKLQANLDLATKVAKIPKCDYYYDMIYELQYSSFVDASTEEDRAVSSGDISTISTDDVELVPSNEVKRSEMRLLDLYSGCGAMSTGLCLGANLNGVNLITKWAIDLNSFACESLQLNHPETKVRNESVEDFLSLLKEWEKMCMHFSLIPGNKTHEALEVGPDEEEDEEESDDNNENQEGDEDPEEFEVEKILKICYGDPKEMGKPGLYMQVRWKGYGPDEDTWEPIEGLRDCREKIKQFVTAGFRENLLPLPGDVDVICGGPPCQGISGFNRFRNMEQPLKDPKNRQLVVYMDVVDYLKPKYVLMENVVDIMKFSQGFLGRYALGRLVDMNYQARMGMMAAGAYGLPQFRMRVFLWGAWPSEKLPQYALPTHHVINRGVVPTDCEKILVAYEEGPPAQLKEKLSLKDAISDLPAVDNYASYDPVPFTTPPNTEFQHFIRLKKDGSFSANMGDLTQYTPKLYNHFPLKLNNDDLERVCQIPKKKGANFRDLPGVRVKPDNKVEFDPSIPRVYLKSKKPLVPDYAMSFVGGSSTKPFGRLWWDETVATVVGRAEPHNHALLHPAQDRVLTVRENARLQGFPDYYELCGPVKEMYIQVGNAVAVPVARALGYGLAKASQGDVDKGAVFTLPLDFPKTAEAASPSTSEDRA